MTQQNYKAFGLHIKSETYLPELPTTQAEKKPDVVITQTDLSILWSELAKPKQYFVIERNFILFQIPDVATYLIENGKEITVSPVEGAEEDQIRLYILGTCMGAILMQRNILPLHGSAVVIHNKAYAIVGDSGAGKSTLASAFVKRGYSLLSDDVIPVAMNEEDIPIVTPAYPQQKLWIESLNHFGMKAHDYRPVINRETKYAVPLHTQFATKPIPLAGVIELTKTEDETIGMQQIKGLDRLLKMFQHTYRSFLIERSGLLDWHFQTTTKLVQHIDVYQLKRPVSRFTVDELMDVMLTTVSKEEKIL